MIFTLLRAFANGGASLTGIEAVSDAVGAFRPPEGRNARQVLIAEGAILGILVAGISWLAHATHATPYKRGYPTVLAQEAKLVFGHTFIGQALFYLVQAATMLILYTGGNTSFNGFPFLTSYVAGDSFLPRWLLKRGHRLVFSNAIILLTITSAALLIIKDADVNNLVPLYAIGVFTAFSMASFGMARYHSRHRTPGWRHRMIINFSAGVMTVIVVAIFAVVKFTEGAWVVVVLFVVLVPALIRMNREYSAETEVLETISETSRRRRRTTAGAPCSSSWTASTWPPWPRCGTPGACGRPASARCTSSSTASGPTSCGRSGPGPTAAWPWTSSTWPTAGCSGRRPNWSSGRSPTRVRT